MSINIKENEYLVLYIPGTQTALVFRVISIVNKGFEKWEYGPIPIPSGTTLPTLDGTTATVPVLGVLPARAFTPISITFPSPYNTEVTDMWYFPTEQRSRLMIIKAKIRPEVLRVTIEYPQGSKQIYYLEGKTYRYATGVDPFGFKRGEIEWVQLPGIHVGLIFVNPYNINWFTYVTFEYLDMRIEIPKIPELIFDILVGKVKATWITIPVNILTTELKNALEDAYGFLGFKLYNVYEREKAIREYKKLLEVVKV